MVLSIAVEKYSHCIAAAPPASKRNVSIAGINCQFSNTVCVDYFWFEDKRLFHNMDHYSRYSAAQQVSTTSLAEGNFVFENLWVAQLWFSKEVRGGPASRFYIFTAFLALYNIASAPVPPRRHFKKFIETKHNISKVIYFRLINAAPNCDFKLRALPAYRISNEIYGSDTLSTYEIAKGFTNRLVFRFFPRRLRLSWYLLTTTLRP